MKGYNIKLIKADNFYVASKKELNLATTIPEVFSNGVGSDTYIKLSIMSYQTNHI
jgi:hypothetical protein